MRALALVILAASLACGGVQAANQRTEHPSGFAFTHPPGWQVEAFEGMARAFSADATEFVAVGPVSVPAGRRAADVLRALVASGRVGPMRSPALIALQEEGDAARGLLTVMDKKAQAMVVLRGGAGTVYLMGAPASRFHARAPQLVEILRSFSFVAARAGPAPRIDFARVTEPREQAYSVEFPAGWRSELGVYRQGALAPRLEASAVAPDGGATLFLGERNAGTFTVPTPELAQYGLREGMIYNPTGVNPIPVLRYLPGEAFARHWLGMRLAGARETGARPAPELARRLATERYRFGNVMNAQLHAGELDFDYRGQRGRVTVATEVYAGAVGVQQWSLVFLAGFFAAPAQAALAEAALAHAVGSAQVNPQWLRTDRYFARLDHQRTMATLQATNELFRQTMAERAESSARNARGIGDTLAGTYRVRDPASNEVTTVQAGSNFYYRVDGTRTVIGSDKELEPVDLTRLLRLDWDPQR
ncbi:MAG TPA: hypothetical protein PKO45_11715 [Rubrivivax sp.]|nr:hypothetical protein [Burkholderiales bacterium]HNT39771.1 hypothetical protein [Rubrivivax sp.]